MNRAIKRIGKSLIIYIVISMILLTDISYGYTPEEIGDAVAGYAEMMMDSYTTSAHGGDGQLQYSMDDRDNHPQSDEERNTRGFPWVYDCSSFTVTMYNIVCGMNIIDGNTTTLVGHANLQDLGEYSDDKKTTIMKPGDIVCYDQGGGAHGHVEIFISAERGSGGAHNSSGGVSIRENGSVYPDESKGAHIYRLTEEAASKVTNLLTKYAKGVQANTQTSASAINYSNFYFNGIPDGKYSLTSRKSLFQIIADTLASLANLLTGLITYIFRGVIISFISVFDRILNNTMDAMNGKKQTLQQSGVDANDADDPSKINRSVTIEGIVFGDEKMDLFDINIFRVD